MRPIFAATLLLLLLGCSNEDAPQAEGPKPVAGTSFVGKWKVVGDTAGQGHKGELDLKADGTFASTYDDGKKVETFSGTYTVSGAPGAETVSLAVETYNGAPAPSAVVLNLHYDKSRDLLNDLLTVAYARSGA
jgi:hypothetical protein